jgi:hypothetical protein
VNVRVSGHGQVSSLAEGDGASAVDTEVRHLVAVPVTGRRGVANEPMLRYDVARPLADIRVTVAVPSRRYPIWLVPSPSQSPTKGVSLGASGVSA